MCSHCCSGGRGTTSSPSISSAGQGPWDAKQNHFWSGTFWKRLCKVSEGKKHYNSHEKCILLKEGDREIWGRAEARGQSRCRGHGNNSRFGKRDGKQGVSPSPLAGRCRVMALSKGSHVNTVLQVRNADFRVFCRAGAARTPSARRARPWARSLPTRTLRWTIPMPRTGAGISCGPSRARGLPKGLHCRRGAV